MKQTLIVLFLIGVYSFNFAQDNQNIELANIESGSYLVYKPIEKGYNKYVFELAKKKWPVELFKKETNT